MTRVLHHLYAIPASYFNKFNKFTDLETSYNTRSLRSVVSVKSCTKTGVTKSVRTTGGGIDAGECTQNPTRYDSQETIYKK